jgi:glucose/mannose-6-phosphate isomerase|tara:strand:- start:1838 stop:2848 length:1011 start_codon:yes stop_codon:yes gene_type:complete
LLNYSQIEKYDIGGMHKIYDQWPQIAKNAYNSDLEPVDFTNIDHIVFAGMGGSGAIGDLFASILSQTNIHVSIVKGYLLPKTVDKNTLVVTTSVSGNTIETLTVLNSVKDLDCHVIAFSSGGKMEEFCGKHKINFKKINLLHSPRTSFINFSFSILKILYSILPVEKNHVSKTFDELSKLQNNIGSQNLSDSNSALDLATFISGIPLIYYPYGLQPSATRFKSSIQENAKTHAIIEDIVEASHNGIVAWERSSNIQPILLRGYDDYIKTKDRFEIIKEFFDKNNIKYKEISSVPGNIFTKIITLTYLLDYSSLYLAILSGIDPSPVLSINFIKDRI